ncbi:RcnB family protein [Phenylobacterium sp. J367]|uniref:RcnB family protein n=1 Tax=Phenylobacterium sp. J367 TaxID=2898435 RepID=UPI0021517839|nr:RcnB family protein [Phenylobacterium sp. J367]MCR5880685.1 RcnB family protein [Phenylobacterium sp. J367]
MNRRLATLLIAAATLAGPLLAGSEALARDDRGRGNGRGGWEQRGDRGPPRGQGERGQYERRQPDRQWVDDGPRRDRGPRAARARTAGTAATTTARRPGRTPSHAPTACAGAATCRRTRAGAEVQDPERYRLRPPPRGFRWVRAGGGYALVGPDGQIFDMIR